MEEKKILLNAAACLKYLSHGKDPVTKKDVPEDDTVRNPIVAKYLNFAAEKIEEILAGMETDEENVSDSETIASESPETENIPAEVHERIVCDDSGEALRIGEIREILNRGTQPSEKGYISTGILLSWLEYNGFIEKNEKNKYIVTESGMEAGIFPQESVNNQVSLCYTPAVQQMIYDNEDDIREYNEKYGDKRKPFFISPDKKAHLRAGDDATGIKIIASYLNEFVDTENYKPVQGYVINKWLASKNMISKNNPKRYMATTDGEAHGFRNVETGRYPYILYTSQAWQYIIENIDELIEYNDKI